MTPDELEAAVLDGDRGKVAALVRTAAEADRLAFGARALALQKRLGSFQAHLAETTKLDGDRGRASTLALLGTGSAAQIRAGAWMHTVEGDFDILRCRPSDLLVTLGPWLVEKLGWQRVRNLVRSGAMPRPGCDEYYVGMLNYFFDCRALVRDDPGLLEVEVWRLFEIEGSQQLSLADHDKYSRDTWADILLELAASAPDKRERLLDASLAALERDFIAFRAGWFSRFHEALKPTAQERSIRTAAYLRLLRSPIPATVSMAVAALAEVQRPGQLDGAALLGHVAPALHGRAVSTARAALKLVDAAVRAQPDLARSAAPVIAEALAHPSAEIQATAIGLLEWVLDPSDEALADAIARQRGDVAASLRNRFELLLARFPSRPLGAATTFRAPQPPPPAPPPVAQPADPFATLEPVTPIATLPELVEAIAHVYENSGPPVEIERALDGISRLSAERPSDFDRLVLPIRKRADQIRARHRWGPRNDAYGDGYVAAALAALVIGWIDGEALPLGPAERVTLGSYNAARVAEIARWAAARTGEPMLAALTHGGGWIEPTALVDRLARRLEAGRTPEDGFRLDLVQAMLRLLPLRRAEALAAARRLPAVESAAALRYALGGEEKVGRTRALWIAAARCRNPDVDDVAVDGVHGGLGPGGARAGAFSVGYRGHMPALNVDPSPGVLSADLPTVLLATEQAGAYGISEYAGFIDWMRLIWPQSRRSWFAASAAKMAENLDWWSAEWENRRRLEPLFEPWTAIGREAALLLAVVLQAKEPGEQGLAVEATATLLAARRMSAGQLRHAVGELEEASASGPAERFGRDLLRPRRFAGAMERLATVSPEHALGAQEIMASTLGFFAGRHGPAPVPVGQLTAPLRLLVELGAQLGRPVPESGRPALEGLAAGKATTAAAQLARRLLTG